MSICIGITKSGSQCTHKSKFGEFCGMHKPKVKKLAIPLARCEGLFKKIKEDVTKKQNMLFARIKKKKLKVVNPVNQVEHH